MSRPSERAVADLTEALGSVKSGTLRVFGDWFGRPMDNNHVIRAARAEGEDAVITFDDDEVLRITRPDAWHFDDQVFRVETAERVEWKWFLYGSPKTPENLYTIEHWVDAAGNVHARSNVDWYQPNFTPSTSEAAVELL